MSLWFGEPWPSAKQPAPVCEDEADHVPVPVGEQCAACGVAIVADDRGVLIPYAALPPGAPRLQPWHIECLLGNVLPPDLRPSWMRSRG